MTVVRTVEDLPRPAEVADVGLAASPWAMVFFALLWGGAGARIALYESRRGHELRHLVGMGIAMGPFLAAYAVGSLRRLESTARPVVVRPSPQPDRRPELLIALCGPAHLLADVRPMLTRLARSGGSVEVALSVTFDAARDHDLAQPDAMRELEAAGLFLHDLDPALVLLPGSGFASFRDRAQERGADFLAVVDRDPDTGRGRVEILAVHAGRQVHQR
ncbi:MAG: hypothetical protein OSA99_13330 [Acidimicrobiales bacterium]|nr:hypothetical protein [Acidimicrobiales bacterium]